VAVDVLGHGVDDDIGAVVERVLDVGAHEGVVDDNENAMAVGDLGNGLDIDQAEGGVGGGLDPDELGLRTDEVLDVKLNGRREGHLNAVGGGDLGEVAVGTTVDIGDRDNVGSRGQGLQDNGSGGRARRESKGILGVLESGNRLLKVVTANKLVIKYR
jgi:hypothetical protein